MAPKSMKGKQKRVEKKGKSQSPTQNLRSTRSRANTKKAKDEECLRVINDLINDSTLHKFLSLLSKNGTNKFKVDFIDPLLHYRSPAQFKHIDWTKSDLVFKFVLTKCGEGRNHWWLLVINLKDKKFGIVDSLFEECCDEHPSIAADV